MEALRNFEKWWTRIVFASFAFVWHLFPHDVTPQLFSFTTILIDSSHYCLLWIPGTMMPGSCSFQIWTRPVGTSPQSIGSPSQCSRNAGAGPPSTESSHLQASQQSDETRRWRRTRQQCGGGGAFRKRLPAPVVESSGIGLTIVIVHASKRLLPQQQSVQAPSAGWCKLRCASGQLLLGRHH